MTEDDALPPPSAIASSKYQDLDVLIAALMMLPASPYMTMSEESFNPKEGHEVPMDYAAITSAKSKAPIVGTYGLASCMGVAIFNPATGEGGITHLAQDDHEPDELSAKSRKALHSLLAAVREDPSQPLEVRLIGPMDMHGIEDDFIKDALGILNQEPNLHFLSADFKGKPYSSSVAMDTRRWDEGLIKGENTSGIAMFDLLGDTGERMKKYVAGNDNRVDVAALPPMPDAHEQLFDARSLGKFAGAKVSTAGTAGSEHLDGETRTAKKRAPRKIE